MKETPSSPFATAGVVEVGFSVAACVCMRERKMRKAPRNFMVDGPGRVRRRGLGKQIKLGVGRYFLESEYALLFIC